MFDNSVVTELKKVLGWRDFWDLTEIPTLGSPLNDTESGEYYQDFSGALRLDYIKSLLSPTRPLTTFLDTIETESITQVLNEIEAKKQIGNFGKDLAASEVVMNVGNKVSTIVNEGRFSGVSFCVKESVGIRATINRVGLYLTTAATNLDLYLFHSSQEQVVEQFTFTSTTANSFSWSTISRNLDWDDGSITGGTWFLGYYQTDLVANLPVATAAIQFNAMNWKNGYCSGCGHGANDLAYKSISNRVAMTGFYVQAANLPVSKTERFDPTVAIITNSNNHGFNFHISVTCNLTTFWNENSLTLKKVIGLKVAIKVLEMMKFSSQINNIEENVKIMIIRDLEGASDTGNTPLWQRLQMAINALNLDEGNLGKDCLPCARKPVTNYGALG
jgi:hypothetical protein